MAKKAVRLTELNPSKVYEVEAAKLWNKKLKNDYNPTHFQLVDEENEYIKEVDDWDNGKTISAEEIRSVDWGLVPCEWHADSVSETGRKRASYYTTGPRERGGSIKELYKKEPRLPEWMKPAFKAFFKKFKYNENYQNEKINLVGILDTANELTIDIVVLIFVTALDYIKNSSTVGFKLDKEEEAEVLKILNDEVLIHTRVAS